MKRAIAGIVMLLPAVALAAPPEVALHGDRAVAATGDVVAYTVRISNPGEAAVTAARLALTVDPALEVIDAPRGPLQIAAGGSVTAVATVVVGVAARPGRTLVLRARLVDAGGAALSAEAVARLRVADDGLTEEGLVLGRVVCVGPRRRGVLGARVYADSGAAARVDFGGAYHLSRLRPGVHLVKLDTGTLPPGATLRGEASRLVTLGRGLPARVDFEVVCPEYREVGPSGVARAPGTSPPRRREVVVVAGELGGPTATVDGAALALPEATLELDGALRLPGATANLRPPDDTPLRFRGAARWPAGVSGPRAWTLRILQVAPAKKEIRSLGGAGSPGEIAWDGNDDAGRPAPRGALYEAQLVVVGDELSTAASRRLRFGVTWGFPPPRETTRVLRGDATAELARIARALGPTDRVSLEVHDDGSGDDLEKLGATAQQAQRLRDALVAAGVDAERVRARGRGNLAPLAPGRTAAARARNRRVVIVVTALPREAGPPIAAPEPLAPDARVGGARVAVDARGRFSQALPLPIDGRLLVDLLAADGRQAARTVRVGASAALKPLPEPTTTVSGDVATGAVTAFGRALDTAVLGVAVGLRGASGLSRRVVLAPQLPAGLGVVSWQLAIWSADGGEAGEPVLRLAGAGAPPGTLSWDGKAVGDRFIYRLSVEAADGSRGESSLGLVDLATPSFAQGAAGTMFLAGGEPTANLRRQLGAFAAAVGSRARDERFRVEITAAVPPDMNAAEARLARAARAGRVKALLASLGVPLERVEINVSPPPPSKPGAERLFVTTSTRAPAPPPEVTIDGAAVPLAGTTFSRQVTVAPGGAVTITLRTVDGRRGTFVARATRPEGPIPRLRDLKDPGSPPEVPAPTAFAAPVAVEAPTVDDEVPAARVRVRVPPWSTELSAPDFWLSGSAPPGVALSVGGRAIDVRSDGSFDALIPVAHDGYPTLVAVDARGNRASVTIPVWYRQHGFLLVLGEGVAGNVHTAGMTERATWTEGDAVLSGRLAVLFKGQRMVGARPLELTLHLDTAKQNAFEPLFPELSDPTVDFPVYGDAAEETREAAARGLLTLRARWGESRATVGSFVAEVGREGDLVRYDRAVSGVELLLERDSELKLFAATRDAGVAHAVDLFRATGGALYYLRHDRLVTGGERVRVIVRDRDSGRVRAERTLARNADYTLDDVRGRLLLKEPLASTAEARSILDNLAAALSPLDGHPVYLEVGYEYEPDAGEGGDVAGVAGRWAHGDVSVGGAFVDEDRGDGSYQLAGVHAEWRPRPRTALRVELARSSGIDAPNLVSADGGLSFGALGAVGDGGELAFRAEVASSLGEVLRASWADATRVSLYAQELADGFRAAGTLLEQGRRKLGGAVAIDTGADGTLTVRNDTETAGGDTTTLSRVRWAQGGDRRVGLAFEAGHQRTLDADRVGAAAQVAWRAARRLVLRAVQEAQTATGDDRLLDARGAGGGVATSVGADVELAKDLFFGATGTVRWNGDTALQAGLRSPVDENASVYAHERVEGRGGRLVAASVVGGEERLGGGGRAYGEYQIQHGVSAARNRAVLGVLRRFVVARGVRLAAGYEHQRGEGGVAPDGSEVAPLLRDVVHGAAELLLPERLKLGASIELRLEDGDGGGAGDAGLATPLVLPPGKRRQVVAIAAADWKSTPEQTLLARVRLADTQALEGDDRELAHHLELTVGWALRPLELDWLDLLVRYSFLDDRRPDAVLGLTERSHVLVVAPLFVLPRGVMLGGKLAWKRSLRELGTAAGDASRVDAYLAALRVGVRVRGRWEGAVEARVLNLDLADSSESRLGALVEIAYDLARFARIGAGYDFSRFSDDELGDLERDGHGFFVRVVGRY